MTPLNLQACHICLDQPVVAPECDTNRWKTAVCDIDSSEEQMLAARGICIALGLSAAMWLIVFATVAYF
ncbi:hypothetical protein [Povalibacter sp.]|uniref:hypothetical protein n=1 Tax=Povalibacter sp. TaxID=1962978 RepID=UPI002F4283EF